jgi:hypothetical protein
MSTKSIQNNNEDFESQKDEEEERSSDIVNLTIFGMCFIPIYCQALGLIKMDNKAIKLSWGLAILSGIPHYCSYISRETIKGRTTKEILPNFLVEMFQIGSITVMSVWLINLIAKEYK